MHGEGVTLPFAYVDTDIERSGYKFTDDNSSKRECLRPQGTLSESEGINRTCHVNCTEHARLLK